MLARTTVVSGVLVIALVFGFACAHASSDAHSHAHDHLDSNILGVKTATYGHKCIYDERAAKAPPPKRVDQVQDVEEINADGTRNPVKRLANWKPFRVTVALDNLSGDTYTCYSAGTSVPVEGGGTYSCTSNDIMDQGKLDYLNNSMLSAAVSRFHELLDVDRGLFITVADNTATACSSVPMPSRFKPTYDTDFILLVTTRPIPSSNPNLKTLAYATTCQTGTGGRPIVGWANFDPSALTPTDDSKLALQVGVATHEISHSLGFNYGAFSSQGMVTRDASGSYRVTSSDVVNYVRAHFGCATAPGALLENDGGAGTADSHWEKSAFMNEYMTGTASNDPVVSPLTLLAFEATGWYQAHLERSDSLVFGRNGGCPMISDWTGCTNWPPSYKCDGVTGTISKCAASGAGYGPCVTEPSIGSLIGGGCTYYSSDTTCIFPFPPNSSQAQSRAGNSALQSSGQSFAADSRCFDSTLNKVTSLSEILPVPAPSSPKCFRVHCSDVNEPRLSIDNIWYPCLQAGNKISATGFGGGVTCPANAFLDLCQNRPREDDWPRITGINPKKTKPGTQVTVGFTGAANDTGVTIMIEADCSSNAVANESVSGTLPPSDFWGSPRYLNIFNTKLNVIIKDSQGRSDVSYDAFQVDIGFGLAYLKALWAWMKKHALITVLICIGIAIPIIIICFCCYRKCCKKKKKKPMRTQYQHTYDRENDDYYYDEEMDDRSRHAPPRPIH